MNFEWKDPPEAKGGWKWADRLEPLREHPGRWASFGNHERTTVGRINSGQYADIEPGEFEATSRRLVDVESKDRGELFVRYIGDAE